MWLIRWWKGYNGLYVNAFVTITYNTIRVFKFQSIDQAKYPAEPELVDGELGIASFIASNFLALVKTLDLSTNSSSIAFLPSKSNPFGTLPSGHIPLS